MNPKRRSLLAYGCATAAGSLLPALRAHATPACATKNLDAFAQVTWPELVATARAGWYVALCLQALPSPAPWESVSAEANKRGFKQLEHNARTLYEEELRHQHAVVVKPKSFDSWLGFNADGVRQFKNTRVKGSLQTQTRCEAADEFGKSLISGPYAAYWRSQLASYQHWVQLLLWGMEAISAGTKLDKRTASDLRNYAFPTFMTGYGFERRVEAYALGLQRAARQAEPWLKQMEFSWELASNVHFGQPPDPIREISQRLSDAAMARLHELDDADVATSTTRVARKWAEDWAKR